MLMMNVMMSNEHVNIYVHHSDRFVVVVVVVELNMFLDYLYDMYQLEENVDLNDDH